MSSPNGHFVSVQQVTKRFGELEVLKQVDLDVSEHNVVCLIGASGSGKSTLLRCINLLEKVDEGTIVVDGQPITNGKVDVNALRQKIGIVFQAYNLFPHMTVLQNVTLGPRKVQGLDRARAKASALELLRSIGLADKADEYPDRLSGGQQQRVAIARALAMTPKLLLLDEVTSALDPQLVAEVLNLVRSLTEFGMTMIIATHEMSFAREVADKVCFLDNGVICEQGPPAQIFSDPQEPRTREFLARILEAETDVRSLLRVGTKAPLAVAGLIGVPVYFAALLASSLALDRPKIVGPHQLPGTGATEAKVWAAALIAPAIVLAAGTVGLVLRRHGVYLAAGAGIIVCLVLPGLSHGWIGRHERRFTHGVDFIPDRAPRTSRAAGSGSTRPRRR